MSAILISSFEPSHIGGSIMPMALMTSVVAIIVA